MNSRAPRASSLISRASGFDFANLWMNLAKILLVLVFVYSQVLYSQLGIEFFVDQLYIFHAGQEAGEVETLTPQENRFPIQFLPLALGGSYDAVAVEILRVRLLNNQSENQNLIDDQSAETRKEKTFAQITQTEHHHAKVRFDFSKLLKREFRLEAGLYQVEFEFHFIVDGLKVSPGNQARHRLQLRYLQPHDLRYGNFPVVRGRPFRIPVELRARLRETSSFGWSNYRSFEPEEIPSEQEGWEEGSILAENLARGIFEPRLERGLTSGKIHEQRGWFSDEDNNRIEFTVGFLLLPNEPPRSTYRGPDDRSVYNVRIYYEWYFLPRTGSVSPYPYFNLSRYIIDPDGVSDPLRNVPDVRVNFFSPTGRQHDPDEPLRSSQNEILPYLLQKDPRTNDWHLKITGQPGRFLRPGERHQLTLFAHDEVNRQPIQLEIRRLREGDTP